MSATEPPPSAITTPETVRATIAGAPPATTPTALPTGGGTAPSANDRSAPDDDAGVRPHPADQATASDIGGARLAVGDARIALGLLNEMRHRILTRLFATPRDRSLLVTAIALGTLADAAHRKATRMLRFRARPGRADAMIAAGALKETAHQIAGPQSRNTPFFGAMVAITVLGTSFLPITRAVLRAFRSWAHGVREAFRGVYGA